MPGRRLHLRLRTFALWLIAFALPLHGAVVVAMPHGGAGTVVAAPGSASSTDAAPHCEALREAIDAASHEVMNDAPHGPSHHPSRPSGASHACSACSACCLFVSLPATLPLVAAPAASHARFEARAASRVRFETGGPLRPPRPAFV